LARTPDNAQRQRERERITREYLRRDQDKGLHALYSPLNQSQICMLQGRQTALARALRSMYGPSLPQGLKVLDLGCGAGGELAKWLELGLEPQNLFGLDILWPRLQNGRHLHPGLNLALADGASMPLGDNTFDLVVQYTVFSSVLDRGVQAQIAREMLRVLKPSGAVLWYDYFMDNPHNDRVRGVRADEIRRLFPGCRVELQRVTLAPPLSRVVAPRSVLLHDLLHALRVLNTHYFALIRPT
jgi:SAM-dependent methyltransferase